jgi:hypothetical protein
MLVAGDPLGPDRGWFSRVSQFVAGRAYGGDDALVTLGRSQDLNNRTTLLLRNEAVRG